MIARLSARLCRTRTGRRHHIHPEKPFSHALGRLRPVTECPGIVDDSTVAPGASWPKPARLLRSAANRVAATLHA